MALDLSKVTSLPNNVWAVEPSADGTGVTDSDNLNYVFEQAASGSGRATINLGAGNFYCKKMLHGIGLKADINGGGPIEGVNETCLVAGDSTGGVMDLMTQDDSIKSTGGGKSSAGQIPSFLNLAEDADGRYPDVKLYELHINITGSDSARPGTLASGGSNPTRDVSFADNLNIQQVILMGTKLGQGGTFGQCKSISQSGYVSTLTVEGSGVFDGTDVGKSVKVLSLNSNNQGEFTITAVPAANQLEYSNASGVTEAGPMKTVCVAGEPNSFTIPRGKLVVNKCLIKGLLTPNHPTWGNPTSNTGQLFYLANEHAGFVGTSDGPVNHPANKFPLGKVNGSYFYGVARALANLEYKMTETRVEDASGAMIFGGCLNKKTATTIGYNGLVSVPANMLTATSTSQHNEYKNAQYRSDRNHGNLDFWLDSEGTLTFEHNESLDEHAFVTRKNAPHIFGGGLLNLLFGPFGHGYLGLFNSIVPGRTAVLPQEQSLPSTFIRHNKLEMPATVDSSGWIVPAGISYDYIISHNHFIGPVMPIVLLSVVLNNGIISHNLFPSGIPIPGLIIAIIGINWVIEKNLGFKSETGHHVVLHPNTSDCSVKGNGINSLKVVDAGNGNKVKGAVLSTDAADLPPKPQDEHIGLGVKKLKMTEETYEE